MHEGLEPWKVPVEAYFYVTPKDANYWVNIDEAVETKLNAATAHVSQFEPSIHKYRPDWTAEDRKKAEDEVRAMTRRREGHYVEAFRYATGFNQY